MNTTENRKQEQPKRTKFVSPWFALPLALVVWELGPWAISFLTPRYGWVEGRPSIWNVLGLVPVLIGTIGLIWGVIVHSTQSPKGMEWALDRSYLLTRGVYGVSRHPMYLSELTLLLGWVIFYGSVSLVITWVVFYLFFNYYAMPLEERVLEAHFGESYREYKSRVRRWLGKVKR